MIIEHTCVAFLWQMNNMINTVRIWLFEKHPIYVETCKCVNYNFKHLHWI